MANPPTESKSTTRKIMIPLRPQFARGEKVLCYHGPQIYETKVLDIVRVKGKYIRYFIHYTGWNTNWDEWVPESRLIKYNNINLQKQEIMQRAYERIQRCATPIDSDSSTESDESEFSCSSPELVVGPEEPAAGDPAARRPPVAVPINVDIPIPAELKTWLVDDWCIVTRQHRLANLPARLNIEQIIDNYYATKQLIRTRGQSVLREIMVGLKYYFRDSLYSKLLYESEKQQYRQILETYPGTPITHLYGAIHLLRVFPNIKDFAPKISVAGRRTVDQIVFQLKDFLNYMMLHSTTLFSMVDYADVLPGYHWV